jgi:hypothetical protein
MILLANLQKKIQYNKQYYFLQINQTKKKILMKDLCENKKIFTKVFF